MVAIGTMNDGRMPENGYTISSRCEPNDSGEIKTRGGLFKVLLA